MNSLSRQALSYLSESERGDKLSQNKLCCLILLLDKEYKSKIVQLDEVLLFHILNHLTDCTIDSFKESGELDQSFEHLIKKLALSDLKLGDSRAMAFNRCTYFARVIAGELKQSNVDEEVKFATDTTPDVEIEPEEVDSPREVQNLDTEITNTPTSARESDADDSEGFPTETEFNSIPAPDLHNIKIESNMPPKKSSQFSQIYKLWNQEYNTTLKERSSA